MLSMRNMLQYFVLMVFGLGPLWAETTFTYEKFQRHMKEYRLNAPWVTDMLMELPLTDFCKGFKDVIELLAHEETRWNYFTDDPAKFVYQDYLVQFLWQAGYYDRWMKKVHTDRQNGLEYKHFDKSGIPLTSYITIKHGPAREAYYAFYASICDCLTYFMWHMVCALADSGESSKMLLEEIYYCQKKMEEYVEHILKRSTYYDQYKISLKKWSEVYRTCRDQQDYDTIQMAS